MSARDDYPNMTNVMSIDRALDEIDRMRAVIAGLPDCPTCGGTPVKRCSLPRMHDGPCDVPQEPGTENRDGLWFCPDCPDTPGRVSLGWLTAVYERVQEAVDKEGWINGPADHFLRAVRA